MPLPPIYGGLATTASGFNATALGVGAIASGSSSFAIGYNATASGDISTCFGYYTTAKSFSETTFGLYNTDYSPASTTSWDVTDRLFVIGNGTGTATRSNAITVLKNGNTGIGTSIPNQLLHVYGTATATAAKIENSGTAEAILELKGGGAGSTNWMVKSEGSVSAVGAGKLNFRDNTAGLSRMVIDPNGNVGIGMSSPANKVHIFNGSSGGTAFASIFTPLVIENNSHTYINLLSPDANETAILFGKTSNAASGVIMYNNSANLNGFQFRANGNITRMEIYNNGNAWLQGTLTQASDARLKTNIHPLSSSLQNIKKLNGYSYNWIDKNKDIDLQIGLLAQEVQKIYPQLVKQNDKGELSVNYIGLVPVLIESLKEQQQQIDELKKLVEKLLK